MENIGDVLNGEKKRLHPSSSPPASESRSPTTISAPKSWPSGSYPKSTPARAHPADPADELPDLICPTCSGLQVVKDPELTSARYPLGQIIPCPTCTGPARRRWLERMCGLEGAMLEARLAGWKTGEWPHANAKERRERERQRREVYLAIKRALRDRKGLYTFWGDFGSGKSHALAVICNELREMLVETLYAPLARILDHLRSSYDQGRDTSAYWERLLDVPVLALDEVTRFHDTGWAREKLFVLVDTRYCRRATHLTLFATNDDPRHSLPTSEAFGYLYSRMREGHLLELRGDMRAAVGRR